MVFIRGLKGKNGISDNMRRAGSQRRHIYTGKMSKKSPASTPAHTAARPPLPRTSKDKDRVQFNVEPLSDDESDGDAYVEHSQVLTEEEIRSNILTQYICLESPGIVRAGREQRLAVRRHSHGVYT